MLAQQLFQRPALGQLTGVPQNDLMRIDADLNRNAAAVVLVHHRIEQGLAQGGQREQISFQPLQALVADVGLEVLGAQGLQRLFHLGKQIAVNFVLVAQVIVGDEKAQLDECPRHKPFRLLAKQQGSGPLQVLAVVQLQAGQQRGVAVGQHLLIDAPALRGPVPEPLQGSRVAVAQRQARNRYTIPMQTLLAQQEATQRRTFQLLLGATTAVVVFALVAHRAGIGIDANLQQLLAVFEQQIDSHHDAQHIAHLVGNLLQQARRVGQAHRLALVVAPDHQRTALGIGKAANPAQILVAPGFLPLQVLLFFHTRRILPVSNSCIMACLRLRVLSRRSTSFESSASMSERTAAMADCSGNDGESNEESRSATLDRL